ncbi:hypothetical protein F4859DRAFT_457382 [Xylaria cf. heliscus]|nr:hypothetical protein F4859DRAFT_457382 [Xylaria cf. heliscus]
MQINAILGTLFAATASGAAVKYRSNVVYNIFGFSASCYPQSDQCGYGFRVVPSYAPPGDNGTICGNLVTGPDNLPPLDLTACFSPSLAYSIEIADGGLILTVTSAIDEHTNATGTHTAPADLFYIRDAGGSLSQVYLGPPAFTIDTIEVAV